MAWVLGALVVVGMPTKQWWDGKSRVAVLRTQADSLDAELASLDAVLETALSARETERLARTRLGMVRPGERAFVVTEFEDAKDLPSVNDPTAAAPDPLWARVLTSLGRVFQALI